MKKRKYRTEIPTVTFLPFRQRNSGFLNSGSLYTVYKGLLNWVYNIFHLKSNVFGPHFGNMIYSDFPLRFGYIEENLRGGGGGGSFRYIG